MAFEWLRANLPPEPEKPLLVHGDFRNGNLIIGPDGLRAVLDWEIAHLGDPIEDLGWVCVGPWVFGGIDKPVGGLRHDRGDDRGLQGRRRPRLSTPATSSGGTVLGSTSWGVSCSAMTHTFRDGIDPSADRAMIGRRASENEIDLMNLLAPRR